MSENLFLGFDSSNYTTSVAVADDKGCILANIKIPLYVKEGERGLRQSDAVFSHVVNYPEAARELRAAVSEEQTGKKIVACAFSGTPRSAEGSYMPCFLVGRAVCETAAAALGVPVFETSHQAGHVMAALNSAALSAGANPEDIMRTPFIALHVSGGTTDMLLAAPSESKVFDITRIGGTLDANAGQIVDRIGVKMGIRFPCGGKLDGLAVAYDKPISTGKLSVRGTEFNLSGLENKALSLMDSGAGPEKTSAFVFEFIARSVEKILLNAFEKYGRIPVVFAGGVMCSEYIRRILAPYGMFSEPQFSSDNAAGVALIASKLYGNG